MLKKPCHDLDIHPVTVEAWVLSHAKPCMISGGQSGTESGFAPSNSVFPCHL
jgi:hypothetical protein